MLEYAGVRLGRVRASRVTLIDVRERNIGKFSHPIK